MAEALKFGSRIRNATLAMTREGRTRHIRFRDGMYETADPAEIAFIKNHPEFGSTYVDYSALEEKFRSFGPEIVAHSLTTADRARSQRSAKPKTA